MAAYILVDGQITDAEQYETYKRLAQRSVAQHGGKYLVRGGEVAVLEGQWTPNRVVVLEFPTVEQAKAFYESADYAEARSARAGAAKFNMIVVAGT